MTRYLINPIRRAFLQLVLWDHERYTRALAADFERNGLPPSESLLEFYRQADAMRVQLAMLESQS